MTALRFTVGAAVIVWWLPTLAVALMTLAWRGVRFNVRMVRVRWLRRAGRLADATAALDRVKRDFGLVP